MLGRKKGYRCCYSEVVPFWSLLILLFLLIISHYLGLQLPLSSSLHWFETTNCPIPILYSQTLAQCPRHCFLHCTKMLLPPFPLLATWQCGAVQHSKWHSHNYFGCDIILWSYYACLTNTQNTLSSVHDAAHHSLVLMWQTSSCSLQLVFSSFVICCSTSPSQSPRHCEKLSFHINGYLCIPLLYSFLIISFKPDVSPAICHVILC